MYSAILKCMSIPSRKRPLKYTGAWQSCEDEPVEVIVQLNSRDLNLIPLMSDFQKKLRYTYYLKCVKPTFIVYYHLLKNIQCLREITHEILKLVCLWGIYYNMWYNYTKGNLSSGGNMINKIIFTALFCMTVIINKKKDNLW